MKLTIYNDKTINEELCFCLRQTSTGIDLIICDPSTGVRIAGCSILGITKDGELIRYGSINSKVGLLLNKKGQIKEVK